MSVACKCKARTYAGHLRKVSGGYPAHTYQGTGGPSIHALAETRSTRTETKEL